MQPRRILALIALLLVAGCGKYGPPVRPKPATAAPAAAPATAPDAAPEAPDDETPAGGEATKP